MKRVILCRPAGPRNVGMILRIVENFGPCELVLVHPERPALLEHPEFQQMSHGVEDALRNLRTVDTLPEALSDCTHVVGFTARGRDNLILADWRDSKDSITERCATEGERVALVFGNESAGMDAEEAGLCHQLVHIRTSPRHTSLNVAIAVGVVLEPLFSDEVRMPTEAGGHPLSGEQREFLKAHLKHVFAGEVAKNARVAADVERMIESVFSRAPMETRDASAWHQLMRALGSEAKPADFGLNPSPTSEA
jgi:tRNA/rRNA methyltransferase